jgi:hypothetical protein
MRENWSGQIFLNLLYEYVDVVCQHTTSWSKLLEFFFSNQYNENTVSYKA